jgi:glycosyltransferase involved in cell wall biosynthesis
MRAAGRLVAIAFHEVAVGGASRSILRIMPLLEEAGWRFCCWTPGPGPLRSTLEGRGYRVGGSPRMLRYSLRSLRAPPGAARRLASVPGYLRAFRAWANDSNASLVHANTFLMLPEAVSVHRRWPTLLYAHETLPGGLKGTATAALTRRSADVLVGISDAATAGFERFGLEPLIVHNGVPVPRSRAAGRGRERLVIGTLGTVSKRKGSDIFLAVVRRLRDDLPGAEFRMIGAPVSGPDRPWADRVVDQARRAGVRCGERSQPYEELREWDIAVVPSRDEPFGLAAAEAMAMGLPVIATRVGGLPEVLGERSGLIVEPGDERALAQAVLMLARDEDLRAALGEAGRARIKQRFTLEQQADGVNRAYLAALRRSA